MIQGKNSYLNVAINGHNTSGNKKYAMLSNKHYGGYHPKVRKESTYSQINLYQSQGKNLASFRPRPQALIQGKIPLNDVSDYRNNRRQRNMTNENNNDDVFFDSRLSDKRKDSSGFQFSRDQRKRMHYKSKLNESNTVRLFVYNVPREYTVDNVYGHFNYLDIDVKDLWQRSHPDARKKSFVVKIPRDEVRYVLEDETMDRLNIRIREYNERSNQ